MKCRFAPSPTGKIHIGNARSAILNWIFCQKNQGEFVLRIDDTDANRSSKEFETSIKDDLKWLGLNWSYTFNQSSRQHIYNEKIQILKQKKRLYPCFETEEEVFEFMKRYSKDYTYGKKGGDLLRYSQKPVSYTHLTLPTICSV